MSRLLMGLLLLTVCCLLVKARFDEETELLPHRLAKRRLMIRVPSMRNPDNDQLFRIMNNHLAFAEQKQKKLADFYTI